MDSCEEERQLEEIATQFREEKAKKALKKKENNKKKDFTFDLQQRRKIELENLQLVKRLQNIDKRSNTFSKHEKRPKRLPSTSLSHTITLKKRDLARKPTLRDLEIARENESLALRLANVKGMLRNW